MSRKARTLYFDDNSDLIDNLTMEAKDSGYPLSSKMANNDNDESDMDDEDTDNVDEWSKIPEEDEDDDDEEDENEKPKPNTQTDLIPLEEEDFDDEGTAQLPDCVNFTTDYSLKQRIVRDHPLQITPDDTEVLALTKLIRDTDGEIRHDPHHQLNPILSKFEKTKILALRTEHLKNGMDSFMKLPESIRDEYLIAQIELANKQIPFIIVRHNPHTKKNEYWDARDLQILDQDILQYTNLNFSQQ